VERLWRSVKYEDVYLKGYASMGDLMIGLATSHFTTASGPPVAGIKNARRRVSDRYGWWCGGCPPPVPLRSTAPSSTAEARSESEEKPGKRRPAAEEVKCAS
jgi:putative transposase